MSCKTDMSCTTGCMIHNDEHASRTRFLMFWFLTSIWTPPPGYKLVYQNIKVLFTCSALGTFAPCDLFLILVVKGWQISLQRDRRSHTTSHSFLGTAKCHEHFLLSPRVSAHATFPAPASWDAVSMCQGTKPTPIISLTSRILKRKTHPCCVTPLTMMDFRQRMSAFHCPGLKLYINKQNTWPSNS